MINNTKRIAIYEQVSIQNGEPRTGGELLAGLRLMDARIADDMQMMEHPVESGAKITDFEVRNPVEISVQAALDTTDLSAATAVYSELKQLYTDGVPLMVKTSTDVYSNMLVAGIPYDELPEKCNLVVFNLAFKEVILVEPQYIPLPASKVRNPSDASTVNVGQVQAKPGQSTGHALMFGRQENDPALAQAQ